MTFLDGLGRKLAVVRHGTVLASILQAMGYLDEARSGRTVLGASLRLAAGGQRRQRGAVIVALSIEDLVLTTTVVAVRDLAHHLEHFFVGLRAGIRVVNPAQPGHFLDQTLREARPRYRACRAREVIHPHQLVADRVRNALASVADVHGPHAPRYGVQIFLSRSVPQLHAAPFHENTGILALEGLVLSQMMPDVRAIGFDDLAHVRGARLRVHVRDTPMAGRGRHS